MKLTNRGFTLVELMTVLMIFSVLFTALYMGAQPYIGRSRDTKRVTSMMSYTTILDTYDKNFDTFPSNMGSGGNYTMAGLGYCLTEVVARSDIPGNYPDAKFSALRTETSRAPADPINQVTYAPLCPTYTGSLIYSRLDYGANSGSQLALIAGKLEIKTLRNYGTGSDLNDSSKVQTIINAQKGIVPASSPDQLFVVYKLH